jgi:methyl-accepting chemotaxis protein
MFGNWSFGQKLGAGFALAALVVVAVAAVGYQNTQRLIDNNHWVDHSHEVRRTLADLRNALVDTQAAQRGYALTGEPSYLQPYTDALPVVKERLEQLETLTADDSVQQKNIAALKPVIDEMLALRARNIETRKTKGLQASVDMTLQGDGKRLMDETRQMLKDMDALESRLLNERDKAAEAASSTTKNVILWGSVIGLLFVAGIGLFISRSVSEQIGSAVAQVQSSSTELQSAASQQTTGAKEQSTAMKEISTTINELLATSRQIAESAQRVASIADQTATAARSGDGTVERGTESSAVIRRQVDLIVSHMLELGRKSQQVGAVLDIVSELAEQTNILAINATIEAAGAGDAGKRFAVVADEIRKLADRVAVSTKEIRTLIDDVRSAVNTTVMTTETGSKTVDAGAKQFADVASAFRQITGLVTTAAEAAREIELSTKQQATAVEQVNIAISNVTQASRETETSSGQTLQTASQLATLSRDLLHIIQPRAAA